MYRRETLEVIALDVLLDELMIADQRLGSGMLTDEDRQKAQDYYDMVLDIARRRQGIYSAPRLEGSIQTHYPNGKSVGESMNETLERTRHHPPSPQKLVGTLEMGSIIPPDPKKQRL